jgi:hypothetical protein
LSKKKESNGHANADHTAPAVAKGRPVFGPAQVARLHRAPKFYSKYTTYVFRPASRFEKWKGGLPRTGQMGHHPAAHIVWSRVASCY